MRCHIRGSSSKAGEEPEKVRMVRSVTTWREEISLVLGVDDWMAGCISFGEDRARAGERRQTLASTLEGSRALGSETIELRQ